jgi:Leucine-rich repeat (LRR) protein
VLNNNRLMTLPPELGACSALTALRLHENLLEDLPPQVSLSREKNR